MHDSAPGIETHSRNLVVDVSKDDFKGVSVLGQRVFWQAGKLQFHVSRLERGVLGTGGWQKEIGQGRDGRLGHRYGSHGGGGSHCHTGLDG